MSWGGTLFWTAALVAGVVLLAPGLERVDTSVAPPAPPPAPAPPAAAAPAGNGYASAELRRAPDGHFYADAQVNGARVRFLIDTGASLVALTPDDARRAGVTPGSERGVAMAAGGPVETAPVTIDRLAVGPLAAERVRAAVVSEGLPVSLLGQSFLARVGTVEIQGDRMVLR